MWVSISSAETVILDDKPGDVGPRIGCFDLLRPMLQRYKADGGKIIETLYVCHSNDDFDIWFSLSSSRGDLIRFRGIFDNQVDYDCTETWYLRRGNTDQVRLTE